MKCKFYTTIIHWWLITFRIINVSNSRYNLNMISVWCKQHMYIIQLLLMLLTKIKQTKSHLRNIISCVGTSLWNRIVHRAQNQLCISRLTRCLPLLSGVLLEITNLCRFEQSDTRSYVRGLKKCLLFICAI
jgi:hypothetical protein